MCDACYSAERRKNLTVTKHGYNGYANGCRCQVCRDAKADYMAARRAAANTKARDGLVADLPPGSSHGTRSAWEEHGCRCGQCLARQRTSSRW